MDERRNCGAGPFKKQIAVLTDTQKEIRDAARAFARRELAPYAAQRDRDMHLPRDVLTAMGGLGLMGIMVPEEDGGARQ